MKLKTEKLKSDIKSKCLDALYKALDFAKGRNEIRSFLNDVLTESEKIMIGRRILIAKYILDRRPPRDIVAEMGVGLDTIYRVQNWLGGRYKGYEKVIEKFKKTIRYSTKQGSRLRDYYPTGGFADIKRRYKSYYWLSSLLDEISKDK